MVAPPVNESAFVLRTQRVAAWVVILSMPAVLIAVLLQAWLTATALSIMTVLAVTVLIVSALSTKNQSV